MTGRSGQFIEISHAGERARAFVPPPLPPSPPVDLASRYGALDRANQALGRLDGMSRLLPDPALFLYFYVRKEALLSAQIEGTQSSLDDLLLFESGAQTGLSFDDVEEVSNYVAAMTHGLERLNGSFPLSLRLLKEIHAVLLRGGRGAGKQPGEFRRSQNWIGGTTPRNAVFVPPPPHLLPDLLDGFEKWLHQDQDPLPLLVRAALAHAQFETLHPFLDGNGRLGRLLITLMLCEAGALEKPILYLSLFFKTHRTLYYELLNGVRFQGAWEAWLDFFLEGVAETATEATSSARRILALFAADRERLQSLGRRASTLLRLHEALQHRPVSSVSQLGEATGLSLPAIGAALVELESIGLVQETTGRQRDRLFRYGAYLDILAEGAAPLAP